VKAATALLFVVAAVSATSSSAVAQSARPGTAVRSDSARILRGAKSAQVRFEARRRFLAPRINLGSKGVCQHMGRLCRYPGSGVPFKNIPEEPGGTMQARLELLRALASAASRLPGDGWIAGQRVRYLIEAGNDSGADDVARSCRASAWWCDALAGLASQSSQHFVVAEQAFARALSEMPAAKRCEWTDLSELLDGDALRAYEHLDCAARESANSRIWWLADPLFSTPGNERRTEHFARLTWAEIERGGANGFDMGWAADMKEMVVRYGWAEKWTQKPPSGFGDVSLAYTAHEREPGFHFLSNIPYDAPISALGDSAWKLDDENPRESYAPRYANAFTTFQPQLTRFRRGDSTLIVAAFDVSDDTAWSRAGVRPALVVTAGDTSRFLLALFDSSARRSALWLTSPSKESLASVEILSLDGKVAGRWRGAMKPIANQTPASAISDLLLFDATDSLASGIEGAISAAFGKNVIREDKKIGVYWETYGDIAGDSARAISLSLTPIAPGVVTRFIRALGVGKKLAPVDVRWRDAGPGAAIQPRSILLDLSQVTPGRYELRLTIGEGATSIYSSKTVTIER
jgi:hypothetical protein